MLTNMIMLLGNPCTLTAELRTHLLLSLRLGSLLGKGLSPLPVGGPHTRAGGARQPIQSAAEACHPSQAAHTRHAKGAWLLQQLL